jgi:membrane-associated phospholipid phosphatase
VRVSQGHPLVVPVGHSSAPRARRRRSAVWRVTSCASLVLLVELQASAALAETHALRWSPPTDIAVTSGAALAWLASDAFATSINPAACRWCAVDGVDHQVRDVLVWRDTALADTLSDISGFVLVPLVTLGANELAAAESGAGQNFGEDVVLVMEAAVLAEDVTSLTKLVVGRERPFVHVRPPALKRATPWPSDNDMSFFSGHTSGAFAVASAATAVSVMRGYRSAPWTAAIGGGLAATTAYLRIAADEHWLTDVLVGAAVGAGLGVAIPAAFHPRTDDSQAPWAAPRQGVALSTPVIRFVW